MGQVASYLFTSTTKKDKIYFLNKSSRGGGGSIVSFFSSIDRIGTPGLLRRKAIYEGDPDDASIQCNCA